MQIEYPVCVLCVCACTRSKAASAQKTMFLPKTLARSLRLGECVRHFFSLIALFFLFIHFFKSVKHLGRRTADKTGKRHCIALCSFSPHIILCTTYWNRIFASWNFPVRWKCSAKARKLLMTFCHLRRYPCFCNFLCKCLRMYYTDMCVCAAEIIFYIFCCGTNKNKIAGDEYVYSVV